MAFTKLRSSVQFLCVWVIFFITHHIHTHTHESMPVKYYFNRPIIKYKLIALFFIPFNFVRFDMYFTFLRPTLLIIYTLDCNTSKSPSSLPHFLFLLLFFCTLPWISLFESFSILLSTFFMSNTSIHVLSYLLVISIFTFRFGRTRQLLKFFFLLPPSSLSFLHRFVRSIVFFFLSKHFGRNQVSIYLLLHIAKGIRRNFIRSIEFCIGNSFWGRWTYSFAPRMFGFIDIAAKPVNNGTYIYRISEWATEKLQLTSIPGLTHTENANAIDKPMIFQSIKSIIYYVLCSRSDFVRFLFCETAI